MTKENIWNDLLVYHVDIVEVFVFVFIIVALFDFFSIHHFCLFLLYHIWLLFLWTITFNSSCLITFIVNDNI